MDFLYKNLLSSSNIVTIHKTRFNPHFDHLDYHPHYEIYYCPSPTKQTVKIFGTDYLITEPCLIISPPFTVHFMLPENDATSFERYVAYVSRDAIEQFGDIILNKSIFDKITIYLTQNNEKNLEILKNAFNEKNTEAQRLMFLMAFLSSKDILNIAPYKTINPEGTAVRILEYLNKNISLSLDGDAVAKEFHISRATLDRIFKKHIGQSLHQTVTELRINTATSLLINTKLPIAEIALKCGFLTEEYFFAFFKKHFNTTPLAFRKANLQ